MLDALQGDDRRPRPGRLHRRRRHGGARHHRSTPRYDKAKQTLRLATDRPHVAAPGDPGLPQGRHGLDPRRLRRLARQDPDGRGVQQGADPQDGPDPRPPLPAAAARAHPGGARSTPRVVITHRLPLDDAPDALRDLPATSRTTASRSCSTPARSGPGAATATGGTATTSAATAGCKGEPALRARRGHWPAYPGGRRRGPAFFRERGHRPAPSRGPAQGGGAGRRPARRRSVCGRRRGPLRRRPRYRLPRRASALITGGSRGLGLLIARELAAEGARLALLARDAAELDLARRELAAARRRRGPGPALRRARPRGGGVGGAPRRPSASAGSTS